MLTLAAAALCLSLASPGPVRAHASSHVVQLAESWDDLSPAQRDRALHNYQQYRDLPAEKKRDMDRRYDRWKNLPRSDQERLRHKHDEYRGMGLVGD
jgi:Protein of unknown function (DUF3106)